MGLLAAEWTLRAINSRDQNPDRPAKVYKAPPELVVRMSTSQCVPASGRAGPTKSRLTI
jgi:hypothetical protein